MEKYSDRVVYVGNLDRGVTISDMMVLFSAVGLVVAVGLYSELGYGFVEFSDKRYADMAVSVFNRHKEWGRVLRVEKTVLYKERKEISRGKVRSVERKKKNYRFF